MNKKVNKEEETKLDNSPKEQNKLKIPKQDEIWLADFNRKKQKEQSKIRPVLIMSNNWQNRYNNYAVVAPLTSEEEELNLCLVRNLWGGNSCR